MTKIEILKNNSLMCEEHYKKDVIQKRVFSNGDVYHYKKGFLYKQHFNNGDVFEFQPIFRGKVLVKYFNNGDVHRFIYDRYNQLISQKRILRTSNFENYEDY
ncbi:hypothetical protein [Candidatus Phytoplasma pruni]|uniref:Uncharacterized protein n=1 Tax=Candidatus Phytoplasma pruni TaxID=479893 RepID=A0A851HIC1_9MOLU|nr:hypothetical protein [Candidatus Phytoplasma pruni]NWN45573.1 hypothetical protein [Candidatus Phytoplasma pruni]